MNKPGFISNVLRGIKQRLSLALSNPYKELNLGWLKQKYYKHLPNGTVRIHQLYGKPFYFYSAAELLHGFHEIFVEHIYKQHLPQNPYIIDCGANIGMSVLYLKRQHPTATIVAFEPDEVNFDLLQKNVQSFSFSNVTLHKCAVWNENTTLRFSNDNSMGSKVDATNNAASIEVKALRLKEFINKTVDFLKIDIEGAEYTVLVDIKESLALVKNMFLEYHGTFAQNNELVELINIVKEAGFSFYIKEAAAIYPTPFSRKPNPNTSYDVQLNIFCFKN